MKLGYAKRQLLAARLTSSATNWRFKTTAEIGGEYSPPIFFSCLSLFAWLGLFFVYEWHPDSWASVTVFPAWLWALCALTLHFVSRVLATPSRFVARRAKPKTPRDSPDESRTRAQYSPRVLARRIFTFAPIFAWLFFLLHFSDAPRGAWRALVSPPMSAKPAPQTLRVVSLNCAGGDPQAMREVAALSPDIVLLQESPSRADVAKLARQMWGEDSGVVHGLDASILARGKVEELPLSPRERAHFVAARVTTASGETFHVVSLRLLPAVFRLDFWSASTREAQTENRVARRAVLRNIMHRVDTFASTRALITGGDFNAPQRDAIFRELAPMREAFSESGRGFGNTITNELPVLRIDQIWLRGLRSLATESRRTQFSDHRVVVCDVKLSAFTRER